MNWNLVFGILALGYGLFSIYVGLTTPEKFTKLAAMKAQWGETAGTVVHVIGYTVAPILFGIVLIASSL